MSHFGGIVSCEAAAFVINTDTGSPEFAVMEPWHVVLHCVVLEEKPSEGIKITWFAEHNTRAYPREMSIIVRL